MSQTNPEHNKSQKQDNLVKNTTVGGDFIFAPQQIHRYIETIRIEISAEKVTQQPLIKTSPYKGLKKFNLGDREYFFGRDALIAKLFNAVNKSNFSLVLGASGSGKSSAVRAGLIPELKKSLESHLFYDFIFTPNQDPFESLYRCLLSEEKDYHFRESDVEFVKEGKANTLPQLISKLKKSEERWFIFIDQFEQLFINVDSERRKNFIEGIIQVANTGNSSVRIVLAMRSDFLEQFSFYPTLGAIANKNNIHLVTEMYVDELQQAIEQPAAKNGVVFEEGLVKQIIKEVEGQKGYLPLLQYTLDLLWQKELTTKANDGRFHIENRTLNKISYVALEGVRGALQKRVDEIYTDICEKNEDGELVTKQIFLKLVDIVESESGSRAVSRRAYRNEFIGEPVESNLKRFVDENLLVSNYDYSSKEELLLEGNTKNKQNATIEIAHEILLSSWDKLKYWLEEEKEAIILKNWLAGEVRRWLKVQEKDESKASDELLKGSRLDQILKLRDKNAFEKLGGLVKQENQYIDASVKWRDRLEREEATRRRREIRTAWGIAVGSLVAVVASSSLGSIAWNQTKQAELNLADSLARTSISLFAEGKELEAFVEAIKAGKILQKYKRIDPEVMNALQKSLHEGKEINRLVGHYHHVTSVSISPDGKTLASSSNDNTIKLWNGETGREIRTLQGYDSGVNSVSISPNGKTLASGSDDGKIKLWNLDTGKQIISLQEHDSTVDSISFSPDGKILASLSGKDEIQIRNAETAKVIQTLQGHDSTVDSISFSPDGKILASGTNKGKIKLWNLETGQIISSLQGHYNPVGDRQPVWSISFSPDGKILASGSMDQTIKLWNLDTGKEIRTLQGHNSSVKSIGFSLDGKILASGSNNGKIKLWNLETGKEVDTIKGHWSNGVGRDISSIIFSPNGQTLISGSFDNTIRFWNLQPDTTIGSNLENNLSIKSVSFSPDGKILASGSNNGKIKLWDLETDKEIDTIKGYDSSINSISFNPNGKILASGSNNGKIKLWDLESRKEIFTLQELTSINSISFGPDGKILASGTAGGVLTLWNFETFKVNILENKLSIYSVSFSPDGKILASGSGDATVKLWNIETGRIIHTFEGHNFMVNSVSFSPDGKTLASGSWDTTIKLWNVETGKAIQTLQTNKSLVRSNSLVSSVSFSPDGNILASGLANGTVKLWNVNTGKESRTLTSHNDGVLSVSFSPDGNILASGSADGNTKLWNLDLDFLMESSCDRIRNYLQYNPNVSQSDKQLCDGIGTQK